MNEKKKPTVKQLRDALNKTNGNLTNTATLLNCCRTSLWKWAKEDKEFADAIEESRKKLLDQCLTTAQVVAMGIPIIQDNKVVGWEEKPDGNMLRYFISTLGRDEGFGDKVSIAVEPKKPMTIEEIDKEIERLERIDRMASGREWGMEE